MKLPIKLTAIATSGIAAVAALGAFAPQAHAADQTVSAAIVGTITLTTPPAPTVLVPPVSLPGNATGVSALTVTSNTAYHVAVSSAAGLVGATTHHALGAIGVTPSMVVPAGRTLSAVTVSTTDQNIVSSPGGAADVVALAFSQPVTAADPTDAYSGTLTYTVSAGL